MMKQPPSLNRFARCSKHENALMQKEDDLMNTTQETEFDYQTYMKESARGPSKINRGTKAREKRREAVKARISQKLQQGDRTEP